MFSDTFYLTENDYLNLWNPDMADAPSGTESEIAVKSGGWSNRKLVDKNSFDFKRDVHIFKKTVPEYGTYEAVFKITAGDKDIENLSLFTGRRNLVVRGINVKAHESFSKEFYTCVFPYIPALTSKRCEDKDLFISWNYTVAASNEEENDCSNGSGQADVSYNEKGTLADNNVSIEIKVTRKDVPVIWVAGDSTLTDQNAGIPYYPYFSCSGWAQMILRFMKGAAVCNLAHSGMTSRCFRDDGHYDIIKEFIKTGDFVIFQFGHNDQKRVYLAADKGYRDNLLKYIEETREFGATPIICSPISRIPALLTDGEYYSLLSSYADECMEICKETDTIFVDLHKYTFNKWIELKDEARDYFIPNDITHTNEYGGYYISGVFMEDMRKRGSFIAIDNGLEIDAFLPESDTKDKPKEEPSPSIFEIEPPYVDIKDDPSYEELVEVFKKGLLDPCVMYLHPNDAMTRGQILMVMFSAFGLTGIRPYNGRFADVKFDDWIAGYVERLSIDDLIDETTTTYKDGKEYFRVEDELTAAELSSFIIRFMESDITKRDIDIHECFQKAMGHKLFRCGIIEDDIVTRRDAYIALLRYMKIKGGDRNLPSDAEVHPVH